MALTYILLAALFGALILLYLFYKLQQAELRALKEIHEELQFSHRSTLVKHGKSFEQLFPYMKNYPYNPNNFRFIGSPIDGISFEDNNVVFVEFKTGQARLTKKQERIKKLIQDKKISWKEIRN